MWGEIGMLGGSEIPAAQSQVDELAPAETLTSLTETPSSALVDVRTRAEWAYVGLPDISVTGRPLWMVEWMSFPAMAPDPDFFGQLLETAGGTLPNRLFFICRSGVRSMAAAKTVSAAMAESGRNVWCTNVAEGFEGDLDAARHRGCRNGWQARGLPWVQS